MSVTRVSLNAEDNKYLMLVLRSSLFIKYDRYLDMYYVLSTCSIETHVGIALQMSIEINPFFEIYYCIDFAPDIYISSMLPFIELF